MKYLLIFLFFLLYSCTLKQRGGELSVENEAINDTIIATLIEGELLSTNSTVLGTNMVAKIDNHIIMQSAHHNPAFLVYKLEGDTLVEVGGFLRIGEGPFEMLRPCSFYDKQSNKLYLYDFVGVLRSVFAIDLNDISNLYDTSTWSCFSTPDTKPFYMGSSMLALNDTVLLTLGANFNSSNLFSILDMTQVSLTELVYAYPPNDGTFNMEAIVKQAVYMDGTVARHPFLNKFVYACGTGKYADILTLSDSLVTSRISLFNVFPKYDTRDGLNRSYADDCLRGMQVGATANAIYMLLMPLTKGDVRRRALYKEYPNYCSDELFVFDWEGKLVRKCQLDIPVYSYLIEDDYLYGVSVDLNSEELIFKRYRLK